MYEGLGSARTWNSRFDSRKLAWSSITAEAVSLPSEDQCGTHLLSQSAGVNGSMCTVCAMGGSRCRDIPTCMTTLIS